MWNKIHLGHSSRRSLSNLCSRHSKICDSIAYSPIAREASVCSPSGPFPACMFCLSTVPVCSLPGARPTRSAPSLEPPLGSVQYNWGLLHHIPEMGTRHPGQCPVTLCCSMDEYLFTPRCTSAPNVCCISSAVFHFSIHLTWTHAHAGSNTGFKNFDPSHPCYKC